ncbi:hypothetical protein TMatcc_009811 [Talaromyces marneffei ATCC 18224]
MRGKTIWNPYDLLNGILDHSYTSRHRAGVFFASASFAFATMGTLPFAADVICLAPKYVNIIRGQFICLILAFVIVPWYIPSLVSIMTVDYFLIRRGNLHISEMFTTSRSGRYCYTYGVNWTGVAGFIAGFCLPLPGFIQSFGTVTTNPAAIYMYKCGTDLHV